MNKANRSFKFAWQVLVLLSVFNVGCGRRPQVIVINNAAPQAPIEAPTLAPPPALDPLMADTTGISATAPLAVDTTGVSGTTDPNQVAALTGPVTADFNGWVGAPTTSPQNLTGVSYSRTSIERYSEQFRQVQTPYGTMTKYRYNYFKQTTTTVRRPVQQPLGQPQVYTQIACWPPLPPPVNGGTATVPAAAAAPAPAAPATTTAAVATEPGLVTTGV